MRRRSLLAWIAGVIAGTAISRQPVGAQSPKPLDQQVADAERAFADSMARRDLTAFAAHVADDAIFFRDSGDPKVLRGKNAVVAGWKPFFETPSAPFSWEPDQVEVLESGRLALSTGPVRDPKGTIVGRFNSIWRLEPDRRWRVVFDKGSPVCS